MRSADRGGIVFRLMGLLCLAALAGLVYLVRHPLMRFAGNWLASGDTPRFADAIIVLSDDNFEGARAAKAAELFHAGWAPLVVASGRKLRPYMGIGELMVRDLNADGVPAQAVVRFDQTARNMREEAESLRGLAADRKWGRLLVVTSNYHTRRARYVFRRVFPAQVSLAVVSAPDSEFDPDSWWETRQGIKVVFIETAGYLWALWELRKTSGDARPVPQTGIGSFLHTGASPGSSPFLGT